MLSVAMTQSSSDSSAYVMYFGFEIDIVFSYDGGIMAESKTTRVFRSVRQVSAPGAKSAVSDCFDALFWASAIKLRFEITCIQVCLILVILYGFLFTYFPLLFMLSLD